MRLLRARNSGFTGNGAGVGVAIADTGVTEVDEISGRLNGTWRMGVDGQPVQVPPGDTDGHGTHVAGLVAGRTVGVAPAADLTDVIMIPKGFGYSSDFIFAIEFVAQQPDISILNMSAGIRGWDPDMRFAVETLLDVGILPVFAIGNEGEDTFRSPGNYSEVLSVGASNKRGRVASFSGGGTLSPDAHIYTVPDLVAPGEAIMSCVMDGGYEAWDGTSMATPIVSGIAALILERYTDITEPQLRDEIFDATIKLDGVREIRQGIGLAQLPTHIWFEGS